MPKVSVIIPIYGVEKYLNQCIDSVLSQTLKEIEIILVDDGSKDNCPQIIDEYAKKDNRIIAVHKKNTGYGHSINVGIDKARGEYIGIIDADDWIEPNMYEVLYKKASETQAELVKSDFYRYSGLKNKNKKANIIPQSNANSLIKPVENKSVMNIGPTIWTAIYKKDFLLKNKIKLLETAGASYQDIGFHFKTLLSARRAYLIDQALYHYRMDNVNSSVKDMGKFFCVCDEWDGIIYWSKEMGIYEKISDFLCSLQYNSYMWNWKRLYDSAKQDFLKRFSDDFNFFYKQGLIKEAYFGRKKFTRIKQIVFHPRLFEFCYKWKHFFHTLIKKIRRN